MKQKQTLSCYCCNLLSTLVQVQLSPKTKKKMIVVSAQIETKKRKTFRVKRLGIYTIFIRHMRKKQNLQKLSPHFCANFTILQLHMAMKTWWCNLMFIQMQRLILSPIFSKTFRKFFKKNCNFLQLSEQKQIFLL